MLLEIPTCLTTHTEFKRHRRWVDIVWQPILFLFSSQVPRCSRASVGGTPSSADGRLHRRSVSLTADHTGTRSRPYAKKHTYGHAIRAAEENTCSNISRLVMLSCENVFYFIWIPFIVIAQRQRNVLSAFNASLVIKEQCAAVMPPGEHLGVQCLAHGHFDLQLMGTAGIEPTTLGLQDDPLPHWATADVLYILMIRRGEVFQNKSWAAFIFWGYWARREEIFHDKMASDFCLSSV